MPGPLASFVFTRTTGFAVAVFLLSISSASADLIKLDSGGEIRGKIVKGRTTRESVTLETLSGATVTVARSEMQFLTMRPLTVEEYESRARKTPSTVEAQWELAEWCRQKALVKQRETHLQHVVQLDPQHELAHHALGHVRHKGGWITRDDLMTSQGYVKHKGKYITTQEYELVEKTESERHEERGWYQKVRLWTGWVQGGLTATPEKQRDGWQFLQAINDPNAAPAVMKFLGEHEHRDLRMLGVKILSHVGGNKPVPGLVKLSLQDDDQEIRYQALQGFRSDQHDRAVPLYVKALRHEWNPVVCRAGTALGALGGEKAIGPLIEALVTSHNYQIRVPGSNMPNYSFNTNGGFAAGASLPQQIEAGLRAGQYPNGIIVLDGTPNDPAKTRVVTVTIEHQNAEVLHALQKITGKNFGYDRRTWHLWWAAEKSQGSKGPLKS